MLHEIMDFVTRVLFHLVIWGSIIAVIWDHCNEQRKLKQRRRQEDRRRDAAGYVGGGAVR